MDWTIIVKIVCGAAGVVLVLYALGAFRWLGGLFKRPTAAVADADEIQAAILLLRDHLAADTHRDVCTQVALSIWATQTETVKPAEPEQPPLDVLGTIRRAIAEALAEQAAKKQPEA